MTHQLDYPLWSYSQRTLLSLSSHAYILTPLHSYTTPACIIPARVPVEGSYRGPLVPLRGTVSQKTRYKDGGVRGITIYKGDNDVPLYISISYNT